MPRSDICTVEGCKKWVTSRRLEKGKDICSVHEKEFMKTSSHDNWKSCLVCKGELTQIRKALFTCLNCNQEYIADEEDMKGEDKPFRVIKR